MSVFYIILNLAEIYHYKKKLIIINQGLLTYIERGKKWLVNIIILKYKTLFFSQ